MSILLADNSRYEEETFEGLDFSDLAIEESTFVDCAFARCQFVNSVLSHCRFIDVVFQQCNLTAVKIQGSTFSECRVEGSKVNGIDWTAADWSAPAVHVPVTFFKSDLSLSTFLELSLPEIEMHECIVRDVDFRKANLASASFTGSDLSESLFQSTNLKGADFREARNYQIDPLDNTITGAKFSLPEALALLYALDIEIDDMSG